ncbi:hypothetical protein FB451DRAFT_1188388 [Mycena latifolia]|nr:hypothetical protein FB451DRAFT_1188388 [Mycena latifolia]
MNCFRGQSSTWRRRGMRFPSHNGIFSGGKYLNLSGNAASYDAVLVSDFDSMEKFEEVQVPFAFPFRGRLRGSTAMFRDPKVVELIRSKKYQVKMELHLLIRRVLDKIASGKIAYRLPGRKDRFRYIALRLFSRKDITVEQFQRAFLDLAKAWEEIPIAQKNRRQVEICFSMSDVSKVGQGLNLSGNAALYDAALTPDFDSLEKCEEMFCDPKVVELTRSSKYQGIEHRDIILSREIMTIAQEKW